MFIDMGERISGEQNRPSVITEVKAPGPLK